MMDIKAMKQQRDEARAAAAKAREHRKRIEWSGNVEKKSMLNRKAALLDAIADNYDKRLSRIKSVLIRAKGAIQRVKLTYPNQKAKLRKSENLINDLLKKF